MFDMKKKPSKNKTHNYYEETLDNQGYQDYQVLGGVTSNIDISVREVIDRRGFNPAVGKVFCGLDNGQKYKKTRRSGCYTPILLASAEGWGPIGALLGTFASQEGLQCPNLKLQTLMIGNLHYFYCNFALSTRKI